MPVHSVVGRLTRYQRPGRIAVPMATHGPLINHFQIDLTDAGIDLNTQCHF
jgi:hypothetical protein